VGWVGAVGNAGYPNPRPWRYRWGTKPILLYSSADVDSEGEVPS
tara:strand:+ start:290 stop:421 length:132 start_codon:yes stop_codon:yes gene_type:complete